MTTIGLLHRDRRIRELYAAVLEGRGHAVVDASEWTSGSAYAGCEVLVLHVGDGTPGLRTAIETLRDTNAAVVAIDDDPEPARHRALRVGGADRVLEGPVRLRDLVDAVEALAASSSDHSELPTDGHARVVRDSARNHLRSDVRGSHRRPGHHLVLAGEGLDISLHSFRRGRVLRIIGTITGAEEPVVARVRMDHDAGTASTSTDAHGRFVLTDVAPGPVRLRIEGRSVRGSITAEVEVGTG